MTALRKAYPDSGYVFTSERCTPFTPDAINRLIKIIGERAELAMPIHCHMLRHYVASRTMLRACGRLGNFGRKLWIAEHRGSANHAT